MMRRIFMILAVLLALPTSAMGELLVADLNEKEVAITTDFDGAELLLFGTIDHESHDDVVIIVEGPPKPIAIRQKSRVVGIWINTESATLQQIPSFYQISSTRPLLLIASRETQARYGLGLEHIPFRLAAGSAISQGDPAEWREALIRNMRAQGLWNQDSDVSVRKKVLFRANIDLPTNVLPGKYKVRILHFRAGALLSETDSLIRVEKKGISAQIFQFAHSHPPIYGIGAVCFAVFMGWGAARIFGR